MIPRTTPPARAHDTGLRRVLSFAVLLLSFAPAANALEARGPAAVGEIIRAAGDEEIRFAGAQRWRDVEVTQKLLAGDELRTGRFGNLALLLRDDTQLRIHNNSRFVVEGVRTTDGKARTGIRLAFGALWARARRALENTPAADGNDEPVSIQTPLVAIGIRGTDWFVRVEPDGRSTLITLSGVATMSSPFGTVSVARGEMAVAEEGKAPVKRVIADLRDRPLLALEYQLRWQEVLRVSPWAPEDPDATSPTPPSAGSEGHLDRAARLYDRGDLDATKRLLAQPDVAGDPALRDLLLGLLATRDGQQDRARTLLARARARGEGRTATVAGLAQVGLALDMANYDDAERLLDGVSREAGADVQVIVFELALLFLRDEYAAAIERALEAEARFPGDPRLPTLRAGFYLLTGDSAAMDASSARAVRIGPRYAPAWHARASYLHYAALQPRDALAAYDRALALDPAFGASWNNRAQLLLDLGHLDEALTSARHAVASTPGSALAKANLSAVLMLLDRLDEAGAVADEAAALDPTHPMVLADRGLLSLYRGENADAVSAFSRAVTADPTYPGAQTNLAIAYYQDGRHAEARSAIETAVRMDPDDPVAPLIGSTMALDQAEVGDAIRHARRGLENALRYGSFAVENLANTQSGIMSVGAAYSGVGLGQWGEYYAQRAYAPYLAQSYSFLASRHPSSRAQKGAAGQGLLLDPTAVSAPTRYFEFLRQPRYDLSTGVTLGRAGGADSVSGTATAQGFLRAPAPVSYLLSASASDSEGSRINSDGRSQSLLLAAGIRSHDRRDGFVFALSATNGHQGVPGIAGDEDIDDHTENRSMFASLGYQRRIDFDNRIFARVGVGRATSSTINLRPLGTGLTELELSLIQGFGVNGARQLLSGGTFDATPLLGFPDSPVLLTDPLFGPAFGTELRRALAAHVDTSPIGVSETRTEQLDVQFRHLFDVADTHLTYGVEWMPRRQRTRTEALLFDPRGVGFVVPDLVAFPAGALPFLFGGTNPLVFDDESSPTGGQVYAQASRELADGLLVEGGVFARYVDDGRRDLWQWDPRVGVAWQPATGHWLRAAYQRELGHPGSLNGTLAPVATVGLVVPDELVLLDGATVRDYRARWDAEWLPWLYSFAQFAHQNQDLVVTSVPDSLDALFAGETELTSATVGVNLWLQERFGVSVSRRFNRSRIVAPADRGNALALIPRNLFNIGVTYVHPSQLRLSAVLGRVGERAVDNANSAWLSPYWTTSVSASWQFLDKRAGASLSISNLFDRRFELARGIPSAGRAALFSLEARF